MKVQEIERRFLLKRIPCLHEQKGFLRISQYYTDSEAGVYRNRVTWNPQELKWSYERIIKTRISEGVNQEEHFPITEEEFYANKADKKSIIKLRHLFEHEGLKFEVDEFYNVKLIICEVELSSIDTPIIFPDYIKSEIIKEITSETEFSNYNLAT